MEINGGRQRKSQTVPAILHRLSEQERKEHRDGIGFFHEAVRVLFITKSGTHPLSLFFFPRSRVD